MAGFPGSYPSYGGYSGMPPPSYDAPGTYPLGFSGTPPSYDLINSTSTPDYTSSSHHPPPPYTSELPPNPPPYTPGPPQYQCPPPPYIPGPPQPFGPGPPQPFVPGPTHPYPPGPPQHQYQTPTSSLTPGNVYPNLWELSQSGNNPTQAAAPASTVPPTGPPHLAWGAPQPSSGLQPSAPPDPFALPPASVSAGDGSNRSSSPWITQPTSAYQPSRPAPPLPSQPDSYVPPTKCEAPGQLGHHMQQGSLPSCTTESMVLARLKEGEAPPGMVVTWRGGEGLKLFFVQQEGHVVAPCRADLKLSIYKMIKPGAGGAGQSSVGLVEVHGHWRMRLCGPSTPVLHTDDLTYTFLDRSTYPRRVVVVQLPSSLSRIMKADLLSVMKELTQVEEPEQVVDQVANSVNSVYSGVVQHVSAAVKGVAPGVHRNTKWIRKGTGSLVRLGGSVVHRGAHFISDQLPATTTEKGGSKEHSELADYLAAFNKTMEEGKVTYVSKF